MKEILVYMVWAVLPTFNKGSSCHKELTFMWILVKSICDVYTKFQVCGSSDCTAWGSLKTWEVVFNIFGSVHSYFFSIVSLWR